MIYLEIRHTLTHFPKLQNTKRKTKTKNNTLSKGKQAENCPQRSKNYMSPSNIGYWWKMEQYDQGSKKKWLWTQSPLLSQISIHVKGHSEIFGAYKPQEVCHSQICSLKESLKDCNIARHKECKKGVAVVSNGQWQTEQPLQLIVKFK